MPDSMATATLQHHSVQASPQNNYSTTITPTPSIHVTATPSTPCNIYTTTIYASSTKSDSPPQFICNDHHVQDGDPVSPRMLSAMEPTNHALPMFTPSLQLEEKRRHPLASATNRANKAGGDNNYNNNHSSITTKIINKKEQQLTSWQEEPVNKTGNSKVKGRSGKGNNKRQIRHNSLSSSPLSPPAHATSYHGLSVTQTRRCSRQRSKSAVTTNGSSHHRHKSNKQQPSDSSWFDDMPFISFNEA